MGKMGQEGNLVIDQSLDLRRRVYAFRARLATIKSNDVHRSGRYWRVAAALVVADAMYKLAENLVEVSELID